jgi:hypothetical protein
MPDQPIRDPRVLEAIEACRPGSDDIEDPALAPVGAEMAASPELRDLLERLQHVDGTIGSAFQDVPVPEGLAHRITARLASVRNGHGASGSDREGTETHVAESIRAAVTPRRRVSRRWILAGTGGAIVAASLAVALLVRDATPVDLQKANVLDEVNQRFDGDGGLEGKLVMQSPSPSDFPAGPDFSVSKFSQIRWRSIDGFLGCEGVAYDITRPGAPRATLYVVRCTVPGLSTAPAYTPASTTRNRSVGMWQVGDLLYVLVVEGGQRAYQHLLPHPTWT